MMPFINPVGHRMVTYPLDVLWAQPDNLGNIEEWAALDIHDPRAFAFAAILLLVMAASATRRTVLQPLEWMLLIVTAGMSIQHVRMLPIFGIISAPIVCRVLASYWQGADPQRSHLLWNAILIAAALALSGAVLPDAAALDRSVESQQPVKAVARIQQAGWSGPMLNEYVWGGYLIWALPQHKVFIDGRADIYAWSGVLREYRKWALLEEDPALLLDRHGIRLILLRAKAPMSQVMPYLPGWRKAYDDGLAVIFVRG
jgi:hypothetical protein